MVAGIYGSLAQLVEHWTFNPGVSSSSPSDSFLCAKWLSGKSIAKGEVAKFESSSRAFYFPGKGKKEASKQ